MDAKMLAERYSYKVAWSPEDDSFVAQVMEWPGLAAHAATKSDALNEIAAVVAYAIEDCESEGDSYPQPYAGREFSGKFNIRIPTSLHRELVLRAADQGVSLNQFVTALLARNLAQQP